MVTGPPCRLDLSVGVGGGGGGGGAGGGARGGVDVGGVGGWIRKNNYATYIFTNSE
jgi:hypothetical protein